MPSDRRPLGLHEPEFNGHEWDYVKECLDTGWVSSVGKFVDQFEATLAEVTGVRKAVACVNGTSALHIALQLCGVEPGDEVLIPTLTFVATANAVAYCGAIPHFVESDWRTLGVDPTRLADYLAEIVQPGPDGPRNRQTGRRLRALVPVHVFGHPVDLDPLLSLCERYQIHLLEDATEALGSSYKGRPAGGFGAMSVLSFNGNKIVTTGGGGAILTNDEALGKRAKHLTTTAKKPHAWAFEHDELGYNYRLPNLNAALGCAQLERLASTVQRKRALAARYAESLAAVPGVRFFQEPPGSRSNYWLNALILAPAAATQRNTILERSNAEGIGTRPAWTLMHKLPMYAATPRMPTPIAEEIEARLINLPSSAFLAPSPGPR